MTEKERKVIFSIVGIMLLILLVVVVVRAFGGSKEPIENDVNIRTTTDTNKKPEKYVTELKNGVKINNSEELSKKKTYKTLEFTNMQFVSNNSQESRLTMSVKNIGTEEIDSKLLKIKLVDKDNKEVTTLNLLVSDLKAGETRQLAASTNIDIVNVRDFVIGE